MVESSAMTARPPAAGKVRASIAILAMLAATLVPVFVGVSPAAAATGAIPVPFTIGQTWNICQGYDYGTHTGTSEYGLDLTGAGCDNSAAGRSVVAPISGTLAYAYQASFGNLCINIAGGKSYTLTHIDSTVTGSVTAGQVVGTVAAAGQRNNNGLAHLHFQMWSSTGCYNSSVMPFDTAHSARICGAPDLTASGTVGSQGTWSGTSFTGAACDAAQPPVAFSDGSGATYANADPVHNAWTQLSNGTNALSASGNYTAWIDGCGAAWATSNFAAVAATQITACSGATNIAIGSQGNLVFMDSCGAVRATNTYNNPSSWVVLTGCGGANAIAAGGGGTGLVGVINSCGMLNITANYSSWTQITGCSGATRVAIGPSGTVAFSNGCNASYASDNYTNSASWIQITGCNGTTKLAVGTSRALAFADSCGAVNATSNYSSGSWASLTGCNGALAIAMGTGGKTGVINGCGILNVTSDFTNWTQISPCSGATRVAIG